MAHPRKCLFLSIERNFGLLSVHPTFGTFDKFLTINIILDELNFKFKSSKICWSIVRILHWKCFPFRAMSLIYMIQVKTNTVPKIMYDEQQCLDERTIYSKIYSTRKHFLFSHFSDTVRISLYAKFDNIWISTRQ